MFFFSCCITPVYLFLNYYWYYTTGDNFIYGYHVYFFAWITYYLIGLYFRVNANTISIIKNYISKEKLLIATLFFGACVLLESYYATEYGFVRAYTSLKITVIIYSIAIFILSVLFEQKYKEFNNIILNSFGDNSLGIFYIHYPIIVLISRVMKNVNFVNWIYKWCFFFITASILSILVVLITKEISRKCKVDGLLRIVGF